MIDLGEGRGCGWELRLIFRLAFLKRTKKYLETEAVFKDDEEGLRNAKTAEEKKKEAIETFLGGAQAAMKKLTAKFGDYECYIGEAGPSEKDDQQ